VADDLAVDLGNPRADQRRRLQPAVGVGDALHWISVGRVHRDKGPCSGVQVVGAALTNESAGLGHDQSSTGML
jgi:hypothetical protein